MWLIPLGIIIFSIGIMLIFFKDTAWKLQKWSNDIAGRESKRTRAWEISHTILGFIHVGFVLLVCAFYIYLYLTY